jgi:hypothetical protein
VATHFPLPPHRETQHGRNRDTPDQLPVMVHVGRLKQSAALGEDGRAAGFAVCSTDAGPGRKPREAERYLVGQILTGPVG